MISPCPTIALSVSRKPICKPQARVGIDAEAGEVFFRHCDLNEVHSHNWSFSDDRSYRFSERSICDAGNPSACLRDQQFRIGVKSSRRWLPSGGPPITHGHETVFLTPRRHQRVQFLAGGAFLLHAKATIARPARERFSTERTIWHSQLVYKWSRAASTIQNLSCRRILFEREDGSFNGVRLNNYDRTGWYLQGVYHSCALELRLALCAAWNERRSSTLGGSTLDDLGHVRALSRRFSNSIQRIRALACPVQHDDSDLRPFDQISFNTPSSTGAIGHRIKEAT